MLSALESTLDIYIKDRHVEEIPLYYFLDRKLDTLNQYADDITSKLNPKFYEIVRDHSYIGGGALPVTN